MAMKVLLGLQVVPSCYRLILQKYTDEEDYYMNQLETANVAIKVKEFNDTQGTKGVITMNAIQSKMMKKKHKQTKIDRPSI